VHGGLLARRDLPEHMAALKRHNIATIDLLVVNRYELEDEPELELHRIDPTLEGKQIDRVQALRARRDPAAVERELARLTEGAARDDVNLMPIIVDAARAYVTMGEMCDALRSVWGVWRETPVF